MSSSLSLLSLGPAGTIEYPQNSLPPVPGAGALSDRTTRRRTVRSRVGPAPGPRSTLVFTRLPALILPPLALYVHPLGTFDRLFAPDGHSAKREEQRRERDRPGDVRRFGPGLRCHRAPRSELPGNHDYYR